MIRMLLPVTLLLLSCACANHPALNLNAQRADLCPALPPAPAPPADPNWSPMLDWLKSLGSPSSTGASSATTTIAHE